MRISLGLCSYQLVCVCVSLRVKGPFSFCLFFALSTEISWFGLFKLVALILEALQPTNTPHPDYKKRLWTSGVIFLSCAENNLLITVY